MIPSYLLSTSPLDVNKSAPLGVGSSSVSRCMVINRFEDLCYQMIDKILLAFLPHPARRLTCGQYAILTYCMQTWDFFVSRVPCGIYVGIDCQFFLNLYWNQSLLGRNWPRSSVLGYVMRIEKYMCVFEQSVNRVWPLLSEYCYQGKPQFIEGSRCKVEQYRFVAVMKNLSKRLKRKNDKCRTAKVKWNAMGGPGVDRRDRH